MYIGLFVLTGKKVKNVKMPVCSLKKMKLSGDIGTGKSDKIAKMPVTTVKKEIKRR